MHGCLATSVGGWRAGLESVVVAVFAVGVVGVGMGQGLVGVQVAVPGAGRHRLVVLVLVVLVMNVLVVVGDRRMGVLVCVTFGQVEPHPDGHQHGRDDQRPGQRITKDEREQRPEEPVRSRSRRRPWRFRGAASQG